jgi:hypothetical protein
MALVFGGALLVLATAYGNDDHGGQLAIAAAERYEWAFWFAIGLLAMTGVGNLAAFGASLPSPSTPWGTTFELKLVAVVAIAVLSVPRTLAIAMFATTQPASARARETLLTLYGLTVIALALVLALAIRLAHG